MATAPPEDALDAPTPFTHQKDINVFGVSPFRFQWPLGSRGLKMAPRGPKRGPGRAKERPESAQEWPQETTFRAPTERLT
eukprot:7719454-Pyramimonas_sp.AAC.1